MITFYGGHYLLNVYDNILQHLSHMTFMVIMVWNVKYKITILDGSGIEQNYIYEDIICNHKSKITSLLILYFYIEH